MNEKAIQLTLDETAAFQKFQERMSGFVSGAQALANEMSQQKIRDILAAREVPLKVPANTPDSAV